MLWINENKNVGLKRILKDRAFLFKRVLIPRAFTFTDEMFQWRVILQGFHEETDSFYLCLYHQSYRGENGLTRTCVYYTKVTGVKMV